MGGVGDAPPMTPAELTASEYLKLHVYPTLEPVCATVPQLLPRVPLLSPALAPPLPGPAAVLARMCAADPA